MKSFYPHESPPMASDENSRAEFTEFHPRYYPHTAHRHARDATGRKAREPAGADRDARDSGGLDSRREERQGALARPSRLRGNSRLSSTSTKSSRPSHVRATECHVVNGQILEKPRRLWENHVSETVNRPAACSKLSSPHVFLDLARFRKPFRKSLPKKRAGFVLD